MQQQSTEQPQTSCSAPQQQQPPLATPHVTPPPQPQHTAPVITVRATTQSAECMWGLLQYVILEQFLRFSTPSPNVAAAIVPQLPTSSSSSSEASDSDMDEYADTIDALPTAQCLSMFFPFKHVRALVRDAKRSLVLIATEDGPPNQSGRVVGMCWWTMCPDLRHQSGDDNTSPYDMHIQHVSVLPSHQRRGIATKLLTVAHTGWLWHHQKRAGGVLAPGATIRSWLRQHVQAELAPFWRRQQYHPVDVRQPLSTPWLWQLTQPPVPAPQQEVQVLQPLLAAQPSSPAAVTSHVRVGGTLAHPPVQQGHQPVAKAHQPVQQAEHLVPQTQPQWLPASALSALLSSTTTGVAPSSATLPSATASLSTAQQALTTWLQSQQRHPEVGLPVPSAAQEHATRDAVRHAAQQWAQNQAGGRGQLSTTGRDTMVVGAPAVSRHEPAVSRQPPVVSRQQHHHIGRRPSVQATTAAATAHHAPPPSSTPGSSSSTTSRSTSSRASPALNAAPPPTQRPAPQKRKPEQRRRRRRRNDDDDDLSEEDGNDSDWDPVKHRQPKRVRS